ncbi:hypothetical protein L1987_15222 [Smallanthus sonchifolius]|uniref:Uncharacterized protein n=1 Tax=Smallanthus sonchifolius TaxID=185202 RepID=A0ACB9J770_9ASTR|nr:hypothetical protein L1987_15222 [Smallanthus sonchifolius]
MQHTRSQGSPDFEAYSELERELRERSRKFRSRLSELVEKKIPSHVMNTISNSTQFHGLEDEDAPGHLSRFARIYLKVKFLKKYYPPSKAARLRDQVHSFRMVPDEPYHMAWERFNTLLSKCPQHGLSDWALVEKFYNGLTFEKQQMFNTATGGHIMDKKEPKECEEMFESFGQAEQQQPSIPSARTPTSATRGVHQVTTETSMAAALAAMAKEIKELKMSAVKWVVCRGGHDTIDCPVTQQDQNSGSSAGEKRIEDMLATQTQLLAPLVKTDQETQYKPKEQDTLLRSQHTETNPKSTLKAVTTHRGKGGESEQTPAYDDDEPVDEEIEMEAPRGVHDRQVPASTVPNSESPVEKIGEEEKSEGMKKTPDVDLTRVLYPARLMQQKYAKDYGHFLELFKHLKINLPFVEALQHMPKYAKFLKDLLSKKKKPEDLSTITLNERCSAVVQNKPPEKLADLGVFTIT